jgi:hypothetical protein
VERAITLQADAENPVVGDMKLVRGRTVLTSVLSDEVAQRLIVRFNFWRGEWFRNLDAGLPYLEIIFQKWVTDAIARGVFTQVVATTEGVAGVDKMDVAVNDTTRELTLTFTARLQDGTTFRSSNYPPFVISLG